MTNEKSGANKKREFTTVPARAISDTNLTALELRCLMVISLHDGMSIQRGKGAGCYARYSTLAEIARTDISNFSKAASRLQASGYLIKERQATDKRRHTLRVVPDSVIEKVGDPTNLAERKVGEPTNQPSEIVGGGLSETGGNQPIPGPQYISLNDEINSEESGELDSVETAQLADREPRHDDRSFEIKSIIRSVRKDAAEAGLCEGERASIKAHLPEQWFDLSIKAQLVHLERALKQVAKSAHPIDPQERKIHEDYLAGVFDKFAGEQAGHHAERLLEEMEIL